MCGDYVIDALDRIGHYMANCSLHFDGLWISVIFSVTKLKFSDKKLKLILSLYININI